MAELTEKEINNAIKNCKWRQTSLGVPICGGNCNICAIEIERGRCDTLKKLFAKSGNTKIKRKADANG